MDGVGYEAGNVLPMRHRLGLEEIEADRAAHKAHVLASAKEAQASWMKHCRKVADERRKLVMDALPSDSVMRLMVSLLIDAERDHAKAEWVSEGK